eukprot:11583484-Ditylum_brightwellii.AAC.1
MEKSQNATNPSINSASATTMIVPNTYALSASACPLCQCAISILSSTAQRQHFRAMLKAEFSLVFFVFSS